MVWFGMVQVMTFVADFLFFEVYMSNVRHVLVSVSDRNKSQRSLT